MNSWSVSLCLLVQAGSLVLLAWTIKRMTRIVKTAIDDQWESTMRLIVMQDAEHRALEAQAFLAGLDKGRRERSGVEETRH
jgi:hypothetical protein